MNLSLPILIGIGSNEQPERAVRQAEQALRDAFGEVTLSRILRTAPLDGRGPDYLNAVALVYSDKTPAELNTLLKTIEDRLGRQRQQPANAIPRIAIDLDLLLVGDICDDSLKLPAAELTERPFCLFPAAELLPEWRHPRHHATLRQLAEQAQTDKNSTSGYPLS
ncbi:MAG: 2-amino-4-hydroxy-6-hydroxymethyldihydropteridine diphosphokinase [Lentisphaerae bacterium]|nr:2-amino-4-hydroxy-6-hydroxymethyldihydropteridine diphosphokinase [Lentisphaerota bacterium]